MENLRATPDYFRELYEKNLPGAKSYKEAYERAEEEHQKLCGSRCYSDHGSFRVVYNRKYKNRK